MLDLRFESRPGELGGMRDAVRQYLADSAISDMDAELIVLALDEACTNIIRHAYLGDCDRPIHLRMDASPARLTCTIRDYGKPCDPNKIRSRELTDFRPGGLGIRIIQSAFDHVEFIPLTQGTRLTLVKDLQPNEAPQTQ